MSEAVDFDRAVDSVLRPVQGDADAAVGQVLTSDARRTAVAAQGLSPESAARGIENAPTLGVDPSFASQDDVLAAVATRKMAQRLAQAPGLSRFAQQSQAHAAVIKDDYENLTPLEWWLTGRWEMGGQGEEPIYDPGTGLQ